MNDIKEKLFGHKKIPLNVMIKRSYKYIKPELKRIIGSLILIIFNVVLDVILPLLIKGITDNLALDLKLDAPFIDNLSMSIGYILILTIGYLLLTIINQIFLYYESMILQKSGQRIIYNLRMEVFAHIENMSTNQLNEMPVGSLVTRVASYTTAVSDLFTTILINVIRNILTIFGVYFVMVFISWKLALILTIFAIIVFVISFFFSKNIKKIFREERSKESELTSFLNENLSGMKITQIFNQEETKLKEFKEKNNNLKRNRFQAITAFGIYRPSISFLYFLAIASTFLFGLLFTLTGGEIVAFYLLLSKFFNPVQNLADQLNGIQRAFTSLERLFNLMDVEPQVLDSNDALDIKSFKGKIEFKNVWFAYENDDWILKNVSFIINPKETVAFVGATGAGKTTILGLIVRNFEIQKGQILIDDIDIKRIKIKSLRRAIGQMLQDVFLFSGTIKSNITLYDSNYSDDEILKVCEYVNAYAFIEKLPNKLDYKVIENGANFSSGQRQLLSFARTVLFKPQILILDEATANIDTETETLIQESLNRIKNIGTMLVVAHRLSTIQHADQIICLRNGEVVEKGAHQDLLKLKGYYYKLYKLQFSEK